MSHHTTASADYAKMYRQTRKAAADHDWPGDPHAINSVRRPRKSVQEQQIHHAQRLNAPMTTHDAGHRFVQIEHAGMPVRLVVKEHATVTSQPDTPMRERTFSDPTRIRKTSHVMSAPRGIPQHVVDESRPRSHSLKEVKTGSPGRIRKSSHPDSFYKLHLKNTTSDSKYVTSSSEIRPRSNSLRI